MMEGIRGSTIKKIRAKAMRDLEAICKKYANIKEDDEGFRIEDIEDFYHSDLDSEQEEEETELRQKEVMHIHRIYSKSIRAAPIDILIRESESKGSLDRPDVVHRKRVRELKLTARSSHASNENDDIDFNCGTQKSVRVKVRRSKRKRKHHHHMFVPPYPLFMPHLHAPPMYTYAPTTCTYTPTMYPCFPPAHAHNSCYICN